MYKGFKLILLVFLLCIILVTLGTATKAGNQDYTFDASNQDWSIYISLMDEDVNVSYKVSAVVIDEENKKVIVLYPNEAKSVVYPLDKVRTIMFFNKNKKGYIHHLH